jgi:hypothetical protein
MAMMRKRQARNIGGNDIGGQVGFIAALYQVAV